jgi:O-antigen biosynthesis protein
MSNNGMLKKEDELERALRENEMLAAENERLLRELREASEKYTAIRASLSWKVTAPLRRVLDLWISRRGKSVSGELAFNEENYRLWVAQFDRLTEADRRAIRQAAGKLTTYPSFSLLLVARNPTAEDLRRTIQSIRRQLYSEWEICIVDDASTAPHVARALSSCGDDPRVRIARRDVSGGPITAGNDALAMARGEFIAWLDIGDAVAESALFEFASEIISNPGAAVIYSDEDSLDARGERRNPRFKTGWNPDLLLAQDYLGRITMYRRDLISRVGGLQTETGLALRATAAVEPSSIRHIPAVLCHRATDESIVTRRPVHVLAGHRKVSVIIPTRDRAELLERCIDGLLHRTKYAPLEIIIVDNGSREERTARLFAKYQALDNVRILTFPGEFNWSAMNNAGATSATGELLLFLNNDTDVIEENWLHELASQAARSEIGAAGAKLLFADGTVQHAGIWLGPGVFARHLLRLSPRRDPGYLGQLILPRNLSAVTGACMAIRHDLFHELAGFDESFPVSYSDIDLCLRLIQRGYRVVWTPYAELLHLESASRGSSEWRWRKEEADRDRFCARWQREIDNDPFFNPNLELIGEEKLALAFPPRRKRAWQA